jgi:hypothetical protein
MNPTKQPMRNTLILAKINISRLREMADSGRNRSSVPAMTANSTQIVKEPIINQMIPTGMI